MVQTRSGRQSRTPNSGIRNFRSPKKELLHNDHHIPKPLEAVDSIDATFLKEKVYERKRSSTNAEADVNKHSALAAGETCKPHKDDSKLHTVSHVMPSLWSIPVANMELENVSNGMEARVCDFFQKSNHDYVSPTENKMSPHDVGVPKNLGMVTANFASFLRENKNVASNDVNNAQDNLVTKSHQQESRSFNLTEIAQKLHDDDMSEVDSVRGDISLTSVNGYTVKPEHVNLLTSILSKHGDIAANCTLKSDTIRSFFMQYICDVVHKLRNTSITIVSETELGDILCHLNDIELACVEVGWLKKRVHEILEAKQAIPMLRPSSELKQVHAEGKAKVQKTKRRLEECKNDIAIREAEIRLLKEMLNMINAELAVDEQEASKTEKMIAEYKSKLRHIVALESLDHGLV